MSSKPAKDHRMWCTELSKALSDFRECGPEKQEERMQWAYACYRISTSHKCKSEYPEFRDFLNGAFETDRECRETDLQVFMKDVLGIDTSDMD